MPGQDFPSVLRHEDMLMPHQFGQMEFALVMLGLALVVGLLGVFFLRRDGKNFALSMASASWPTVSGLIKSASVKMTHHRASDTKDENGNVTEVGETTYRYEPRVTYGYSVAGKDYTGTRINFVPQTFSSDDDARQLIAAYAIGFAADVAYDPADPKTCVLDRLQKAPKTAISTYLVFALAVVLAVAGVYFLLKAK